MGNRIKLYNKTKEVVDITDFHGLIPGKTVKADDHIKIDPKEYDGNHSLDGRLPLLMIFCGGSLLKSPEGNFLIAGERFFSTDFKTVIIDQPNGQNSTGVIDYEVKFQKQHNVTAKSLKFSRDPVLDYDYGWSVQFINGSVKLTREEGVTMILDPSKLFAGINDPAITSLLHMVLKFWPRTFADLNHNVDLVKTVGLVNDLMVRVREYNANQLEGEVAKGLIEKLVSDLNKLCTAKVEWYRPLLPGIEDKFPSVVGPMDEVDAKKLKTFATTIIPLLRQPNSLPGAGRSS